MLVYAPAKQGKTTLLGSAVGDERLTPMILADLEAGTASIRSKVRRVAIEELGKPLKDRIDVVRITRWDDYDRLYRYLEVNDHPYKAIALDSLTEVNYLSLSTVVEEAKAADPRHEDLPEQRDYGKSSFQLRRLIRFFRDLPMHVFFTALDAIEIDPISRKEKIVPNLIGKLSREVVGLVDVVGYLAIVEEGNEVFRSLLVQPVGRYVAGQRCEDGRLGEAIDKPTLPEILDRFLGKERKEVTK